MNKKSSQDICEELTGESMEDMGLVGACEANDYENSSIRDSEDYRRGYYKGRVDGFAFAYQQFSKFIQNGMKPPSIILNVNPAEGDSKTIEASIKNGKIIKAKEVN